MKTKYFLFLSLISLWFYCGNSNPPVRTSNQTLEISNVNVSGVNEESAIISWKTNLAATSQVQYGSSSTLGKTSGDSQTMVKDHLVNLSGLSPNTTYYYKVSSRDANDSLAESEIKTFKTDMISTSGPVISNIQLKSITSSSALVFWETDVSADSRVFYGKTESLGSSEENTDLFANDHYIHLSGLSHNQVYYFKVASESKWGYSTESEIQSFETRDLGRLKFNPEMFQDAKVGDNIQVGVWLENVQDVFSIVFRISLNNSILRFTGKTDGELLTNSSKYGMIICQRDPVNRQDVVGYVTTWKILFEGEQPIGTDLDLNNNSAKLMTLNFEVIGQGETKLEFDEYSIKDAMQEDVDIYEPNHVFILVK